MLLFKHHENKVSIHYLARKESRFLNLKENVVNVKIENLTKFLDVKNFAIAAILNILGNEDSV